MAFCRMFVNPNVDRERYDAVAARLGISSDNAPDGALVHAAGTGPDGIWRVIEVWESEEAARRFDEERMRPVLDELGVQRPAPQTWELHNVILGRG